MKKLFVTKLKILKYSFTIIILVQTLLVGFLLIVGCKDSGILNDREMIEKLLTGLNLNDVNDIRNNANLAISKYENKRIETEPILIYALFRQSNEIEPTILHLLTYDEDEDILGIGINEKYIDPNGTETNLNEEYPIFLFRNPPKGASPRIIPVQIRNLGQLKSEQLWDQYIAGEGIEMDRILNQLYWKSSLPAVWISLPDPNKTEVEIYIYDKAGHKSQPMKLIYEPGN
jgi:hypothetical protein